MPRIKASPSRWPYTIFARGKLVRLGGAAIAIDMGGPNERLNGRAATGTPKPASDLSAEEDGHGAKL